MRRRLLAFLAIAAVPAFASASHTHAVPEVASAYSPADSPGGLACGGHLTWSSRIVASHMRCGTRMILRYGRRSVLVRSEDAGPWVYGRQLDLAPGAFRALGFTSARNFGVRRVRVTVLS